MMVFLEVVVTAFLLAAVTLFYVHFSRRRNQNCNVPGPRGLPLLGYLPFLGRNHAAKYLELSKTFGPIIKIQIGPQPMVVLNSYDVIQEALVRMPEIFSGRPTNKIIELLSSSDGIILRNYDADYKLHRKFCLSSMRGFGFGKRSMENKILSEIDHLSKVIRSKGQQSFDCQANISEAVSNVICNVLFGSRFSYDDENFKTIISHINRGFTNPIESVCVSLLMVAPGLRFFPPFSIILNRILAQTDDFSGIIQGVLDDHKKTIDPSNPRDFVDEFVIEMERRKDEKTKRPRHLAKQLFWTVRNLFVAGTETCSSTIRWAILLFASRDDIQSQFHEEVKRVIGSDVPSMRHKESMPYVRAFIQELMRHRTLVPLSVPHATMEDTTFRGYRIPKGQTVLPNLWAIHYDPENFERPQDFIPERFIDSDGTFKKEKRVIPFSVGPRACLGEQLARMEIFLFLTGLIQRFKICTDPSKPLPSFNDGIFGFAHVPKLFKVFFKPRQLL